VPIRIDTPPDFPLEDMVHLAIATAANADDGGCEFTYGNVPMVAYSQDSVETLVAEWERKDRLRRDMSVLTNGQVAKICRVASRTAARWFDKGLLRGFRVPGSKDRRVLVSALADFMQQHGMPLAWLETYEL